MMKWSFHLDVVKYLILIGANPNEKDDDGCSPIHAASNCGHLDIVKYLIQCGCDKNDKTKDKDSPIHFAATSGHFEVARFLVSIDVNLKDKNDKGKTPLDCAKEKQNENENYKKIMNLLIRLGAQ